MDMEMENLLSEKDKSLIGQIACDNETGNHLLGRKREEGYWEMRKEIAEAYSIQEEKGENDLSDRQKQLLEYLHQYSDYEYYNSLPIERRMF